MLTDYLLQLADNALILGHRNSEWTGHGPVLEQDIALSNIALDLIGQARNFYQLAARMLSEAHPENAPITEDDLAYLRDADAFRNAVLLEQPKGDWAKTILRQFYFSQFQFLQLAALERSREPGLAAIAEKSIKETRYHLTWSSEWVCRLGDGTTESHARMRKAAEELNPLVPELFTPANYESDAAAKGFGPDPATLRPAWIQAVDEVLKTATLPAFPRDLVPDADHSGKTGRHSGHLTELLADMQYLQRTYPGATW